jgi:hypothetical protein
MKRTILSMLALGCLLAFGAGNVRGDVITFDDLSDTGANWGSPFPAGYHGLTWSNLTVLNALQSGLGLAAVSPPNVAFGGGEVSIAPVAHGTFAFWGADFAAPMNSVAIVATGFRGGKPVDSAQFTLDSGVWTFKSLNFQHIDSLEFISTANVPFPGTRGESDAFFIDNFMTGPPKAPEPAGLLLFGIGMVAAVVAASRRRRLNHQLQDQAES